MLRVMLLAQLVRGQASTASILALAGFVAIVEGLRHRARGERQQMRAHEADDEADEGEA